MQSSELIGRGAYELARLIRNGQADPLEVVDAHISQIEKLNPRINALVTPRVDQAREEARRAKERIRPSTSDLPPLFGVPFTVKDALPVAGVRFTAGSTFYRENVAEHDAEAVRRLKAAGAIVLGKTNCSEMSASTETTNLLFGLTRNPWSLDHSAGGSSGGEAALIASCGSPLGLGADFGGSIRIPAAFCGVVGFKPTAGRIPTDGHIPDVPAVIRQWNTVGPLGRRVEDVALAFSVLSESSVRDYRSIDLNGWRLLIPHFLRSFPVSRQIGAAIEESAVSLRNAGMAVEHVSMPLMRVSLESTGILCREWIPQFRVALGRGQPIHLWEELLAHYRHAPRVSAASITTLAMVSFGSIMTLLGYGRFKNLKKFRNSILQSMGRGSLLLWPVFPSTAPKHGFAWKPNKAPNYTMVFNSLGFPAIAVPVGISGEGLPLSVQVIGRPDEDETVLAVASVLEEAFGGWKRPAIA